MNILLIDNQDSFTHNLRHLLASTVIAGERPNVRVESHAALDTLNPEADLLVISPGPGSPVEYPGYERLLETGIPVLGVCLGMQIINHLLGGELDRLPGCVHGRADSIVLDGREMTVARYHSLHVTRVGQGLDVLARNRAGVIMCLGNRQRGLLGCQFHPESFLSPHGKEFLDYAFRFLGLV